MKKLIAFISAATVALSTASFANPNDVLQTVPGGPTHETMLADANTLASTPTTSQPAPKVHKRHHHHKHVSHDCKHKYKHCLKHHGKKHCKHMRKVYKRHHHHM